MNHPITGEPFDYEKCCKTCRHFIDKTRQFRGVKTRTTQCGVDPEHRNLAEQPSTAWNALPACIKHKPKRQ